MTKHSDHIEELLGKLEALLKKQDEFSKEINALRLEIDQLRSTEPEQATQEEEVQQDWLITDADFDLHSPADKSESETLHEELHSNAATANQPPKVKSDIEKFIGENLINKIGIAITVLGVAIGAKYSIEHNLISPLTRIILGYLAGLSLLLVGMKLKKKYENYSAVLVSGSMTIMYFITFAAYGFYNLMPQMAAFVLMVVITVFTVVAAINYNRQVIAHIGLVGAYAVPFLLSDGSGKVAVLFSYMSVVNVGVLIIALKKYWKPLFSAAFVLSWLMYFAWFVLDYEESIHFSLAFTFLSVFFATFYLMFLAYKLLHQQKFVRHDIVLVLANAFIFYGIGYAMLENHETGNELLGLFTLCNALIHFVAGVVIYRKKSADANLFYLIAGLTLVFVTIAVPVQLDGNWVTLLWVGEATLLFYIGRTKGIAIYEQLSYPLMFLAFFSLFQDWEGAYHNYQIERPESRLNPVLNIHFFSSMLFVAAFAMINWVNHNKNYLPNVSQGSRIVKIMTFSIPALFLISLYFAFQMEIQNYWYQRFVDSFITVNNDITQVTHRNYDFTAFKTVWTINYSLLFVAVLAFVNIKKLKNEQLGYINLGLTVMALLAFLVYGLYPLSSLRESYIQQPLAEYYQRGVFNIGIRYVSYGFFAFTFLACYQCLKQPFIKNNFKQAFDFLLHLSIVWIASSELITWMEIAEFTQSYKLGLSILWGIYALVLIAMGIGQKKKHLRVGAIGLFSVTLIKLFFYDISHLNTIAKTIVFVSLGVLLLVISFLYNKYKHVISDETND